MGKRSQAAGVPQACARGTGTQACKPKPKQSHCSISRRLALKMGSRCLCDASAKLSFLLKVTRSLALSASLSTCDAQRGRQLRSAAVQFVTACRHRLRCCLGSRVERRSFQGTLATQSPVLNMQKSRNLSLRASLMPM